MVLRVVGADVVSSPGVGRIQGGPSLGLRDCPGTFQAVKSSSSDLYEQALFHRNWYQSLGISTSS